MHFELPLCYTNKLGLACDPREQILSPVGGGHGERARGGLPDLPLRGRGSPLAAHPPAPDGLVQRQGHPAVDGRAAGRPGLLQHLHQPAHHQAQPRLR